MSSAYVRAEIAKLDEDVIITKAARDCKRIAKQLEKAMRDPNASCRKVSRNTIALRILVDLQFLFCTYNNASKTEGLTRPLLWEKCNELNLVYDQLPTALNVNFSFRIILCHGN